MKTTAIILAAGKGTRMKSALPKVLHPVMRRPMVQYVLDAVHAEMGATPVVVIGHGAEAVRTTLADQAQYAVQTEQLGTAHAVMAAEALVKGQADLVLVTYGDMPLITPQTVRALIEAQKANKGPVTMLTVQSPNPRGFGRVVHGQHGEVKAIVEEAQATAEELKITCLNVGTYCFNSDWLWQALKEVKPSPKKGEYYLTDLVEIAVKAGFNVAEVVLEDITELIGVNSRVHLAEVEAALRKRINLAWLESGVTMIDPATAYIEPGVKIGVDTVIHPNTVLRGNTVVGEACELGPNSIIEDCQLGNRVTVLASVMEKAIMEDDSEIGPFGHLRKGAHLGKGVHMGNFGEVKNSYLAPGTKMGHFSYLGDAQVGENVNIGAGTITCNFDGEHKHKTVIGAGAFIGSDTMLVAPLNIGAKAHTGAGAVVTHDVSDGAVVVGVPARPLEKKK